MGLKQSGDYTFDLLINAFGTARQRYRRNRHAGLLARPYRLGLGMCTVASSMTTTPVDQQSGSTHVNAYLLS
jgi:hypothetical protein